MIMGQTGYSCTYPMLLCPGIVRLRCVQGNISGWGNPPDSGIMVDGAEASTLIERCQRIANFLGIQCSERAPNKYYQCHLLMFR